MANTNNIVTLAGGPITVIYFTLTSDGTNETNLPIYDSSVQHTVDLLNCKIMSIRGCFTALNPAVTTAKVNLLFDATSPLLAVSLPHGHPFKWNFEDVGGLKNYTVTGRTGDITLTTTGLAAGDTLWFVMKVKEQQ